MGVIPTFSAIRRMETATTPPWSNSWRAAAKMRAWVVSPVDPCMVYAVYQTDADCNRFNGQAPARALSPCSCAALRWRNLIWYKGLRQLGAHMTVAPVYKQGWT